MAVIISCEKFKSVILANLRTYAHQFHVGSFVTVFRDIKALGVCFIVRVTGGR